MNRRWQDGLFSHSEPDFHHARGFGADYADHPDRVTGKLFVPGPDDRLTFTVKRELSDEAPLVVKTLENGIVCREQECLLLLVPEDTAQLPFGAYRYDVELVLASGYTDTVIPPSLFLVTGEVTAHGEV